MDRGSAPDGEPVNRSPVSAAGTADTGLGFFEGSTFIYLVRDWAPRMINATPFPTTSQATVKTCLTLKSNSYKA
jgi:hypothetical protein